MTSGTPMSRTLFLLLQFRFPSNLPLTSIPPLFYAMTLSYLPYTWPENKPFQAKYTGACFCGHVPLYDLSTSAWGTIPVGKALAQILMV